MQKLVKYRNMTFLAEPLINPTTHKVVGHMLRDNLVSWLEELIGPHDPKIRSAVIIDENVFDYDQDMDGFKWAFKDDNIKVIQAAQQDIEPIDVIIYVAEQEKALTEAGYKTTINAAQLRGLVRLMKHHDAIPTNISVNRDEINCWVNGIYYGVIPDGTSHS
jgi:hypothetical protein